jgi:enediyne biosynthesis protein E4
VTEFTDEPDTLFRNDGDWSFEDVSYKAGVALPSLKWVKWGDAFVDLDNDGWLDLFAVGGHVYPQMETVPSAGGYAQPKVLEMNQGDGTFCDALPQAGPALSEKRVSRGVAVGDLFNDGNMDIVVEDLDGSPMLLRNRGISGLHWVSFELAGTKSNRAAIGARIKLTAGGMTQTDEVHSGGGYLSQNDMRIHFGLGSAAKIDAVEIRWPSGAIDKLSNLAADKFYSVLEGKGVVPAEQIRPPAGKHGF